MAKKKTLTQFKRDATSEKMSKELLIMGGRGESSGLAAPRISNPFGIPSNAITEDEFLRLKGLGDAMSGYSVDKIRGNRSLKTQRGQDAFNNAVMENGIKYQQARSEARTEYKYLIASEKIRYKTSIERALTTANGHSNLLSTQAARRILDKKGIDWRTGREK